MVRGMHAMFYSSQADELVSYSNLPGGFSVQLYPPKYAK